MALQSHAVMQCTKLSLYSAGPSDLQWKDGEEWNLMQCWQYLPHFGNAFGAMDFERVQALASSMRRLLTAEEKKIIKVSKL